MFTRDARGDSHVCRTLDSRSNSTSRTSVAPASLRHLLARLRRAVGASIRPPLSRKTEMFFARFFCPHTRRRIRRKGKEHFCFARPLQLSGIRSQRCDQRTEGRACLRASRTGGASPRVCGTYTSAHTRRNSHCGSSLTFARLLGVASCSLLGSVHLQRCQDPAFERVMAWLWLLWLKGCTLGIRHRAFPLGLLAPICLESCYSSLPALRGGARAGRMFGGRRESSPQLRAPPRSGRTTSSVPCDS